MSQNALSRKVNGNGKVILDTHPESDQHQNWTSSTGSPPAPTHQIWLWSMNPFLRYLADKNSAHRHTDTRRWPQDLAAYGAQVMIKENRLRWFGLVDQKDDTDGSIVVWHWKLKTEVYLVDEEIFCPMWTQVQHTLVTPAHITRLCVHLSMVKLSNKYGHRHLS